MAMTHVPLRWEYRCKICQMSKSHPELFKELHSQILEQGSTHSSVMHYVNSKIEAEGLQLSKLNSANMMAHFSMHINIQDRVESAITKAPITTDAFETLLSKAPEVGNDIEAMVKRKVGDEVSDYLSIDQLRNQMMEKLDMLDEVIHKQKEKEALDLDTLETYIKFVSEIRSTVLDLNKIRQSRQLMNIIIQSLIERYTMDIMKQLLREYEKTKQDLDNAGVAQNITIGVVQNLKLQAAEIIATTARSAVEDVLRTYKLQ